MAQDELNFENELMGHGSTDIFESQDEKDFDLSDFDGVDPDKDPDGKDPDGVDPDKDPDGVDPDGKDDKINFDDPGEGNDEKIDLELFNKKLNTDFKTEEELKNFLNEKKEKEEVEDEETQYNQATEALELYQEIITLDDEALMRKQYEVIAVQEKKDLNDEEVQYEIDEKIDELKETKTLALYAERLRDGIKSSHIDPNKTKVQQIQTKREEAKKEKEQKEKELLQDSFINIFKSGNFYGLKVSQEDIKGAYKDVPKFLETIESDKKAVAELAMLWKFKEEIYKKAAGLTYADGMKAIVDEFTASNKKPNLAQAQKSGSSAGIDSHSKLIGDLLYDKAKEDKK